MKRRIIAVLLVLCICVSLVPAAFASGSATLESSVDLDQLVEHGISLSRTMEAGGRWDSVANMGGNVHCVGMGIMGWINSSALQLLKWCADSSKGGDPAYTRSVLGDDLYNEVVNAPVAIASELMPKWGYWGNRLFSSAELAAAKTLLGSTVGVRVQKNLARLYITKQAQRGWNAGVRTEAALLYYCSIDNHYGEGGAKTYMDYVRSAMGITANDTINCLNDFHDGVVRASRSYSYVKSSLSYRVNVYNYLVNTLHLNPMPSLGSGVVPFTDMPGKDHWAYDAIVWAYTNDPQVTNGTTDTTFSPNSSLTRGEAVTFLWRAAGMPSPKSSKNPFTDVKSGRYYYTAVLWAVEQKITKGTTATTFDPDDTVTRGEMLTFLWRAAGCPVPAWTANPFSDVAPDRFYTMPAIWAYCGGILVGNEGNGTTLSPELACSRAYAVTYLYNLFVMTAG
ncbi:MAG: S-layer homology domain-containing protein [Oscillospiraceae bacterium]|nr:S-layer homology domain-containing protein [Oscillospiraceae bacterium]